MKSGRPPKSRRSDFAVRLRALRETAGLSQSEIARRLGIRQPSYALWETYNVALKPEQLVALADALGVSVEQFFGDTAKSSRRTGPAGRARQLFEAVSRLPRRQQDKIFDILQPFVNEHVGEPAATKARRDRGRGSVMSESLAVSTIGPSELGAEIVRRLRLKAEEPVLIVEGEDFVLVKRAPTQSPSERFEALAAETAERFRDRKITPEDVDDAVRWSRESS